MRIRLPWKRTLLSLLLIAWYALPLCSGNGCSASEAPNASISSQLAGEALYSLHDHLGNAQLVTDAQGAVLQEIRYYPYGAEASSDNPGVANGGADYTYTGKEQDAETGLIFFGGRYYSVMMGRWISPDPRHLHATAPGTPLELLWDANLYAYARDNPLRYVDPDGFRPGDVFMTSQAAALDAVQYINPRSIYEGREFGGWIRQVDANAFTYVEPTRGTKATVPNMPEKGDDDVDWYHTHGAADPGYDNEHFSPDDRNFSTYYDADGYLGTPSGTIQKYDVDSDTTSIIGKTKTVFRPGTDFRREEYRVP